jgi:hypothetical protein
MTKGLYRFAEEHPATRESRSCTNLVTAQMTVRFYPGPQQPGSPTSAGFAVVGVEQSRVWIAGVVYFVTSASAKPS